MKYINFLFCVVIFFLGLLLTLSGAWLIYIGGSPYYAIAGIFYILSVPLLWRTRMSGIAVLLLVALATVVWAIWEVGMAFWPLFPRILSPIVIFAIGCILSAPLSTGRRRWGLVGGALTGAAATAAIVVASLFPQAVIRPSSDIAAYKTVKGDNTPADWSSYGRNLAGNRFSPFDQINRSNVGALELAWTYRTGKGEGIDQNTPLQIGNTIYTCTPTNVVAALDADTGEKRWSFDPKATAPFWQRCRGVAYYKSPALPVDAAGNSSNNAEIPAGKNTPCSERLIMTTIDARILALDTKTGALCEDFGDHGTVHLSLGIGDIKPGYYYQTSAPLVARNLIVVGGWVMDNQEVGEPSGVIRAFDVRTGALVWAWDLGNPATTRLPPPGQTYTRGTPNMWTTAAFDDKLGLIYAPLGNTTPDYFGANRPAYADEYNASLVALDVETGREKWKFQTVHHDIWDYDLPAQPALIDMPDGKGGTVPAILQTTKRGQLFLLDRATGKPLTKVEEKPVSQSGKAPEEYLSPTQPYSVEMPTIGSDRLTEKSAWGLTMFDQLACRIAFRQLRYDGDFTPIGVEPALQQPGNLGGLNWGSVSVDTVNNRVFLNDIRVPSVFALIPRARWDDPKEDIRGHGPAPQAGTPYGMVTEMWTSPIRVPCSQPPFGTVVAVDLNTRKIAWQMPAGSAEELGPLKLKIGLPAMMGLPSYAGTSVTAGGLVFFAGFQDHYIRAYDAADGRELWKHSLPVGASATPMTYVSPRTGKQYVLISVGGAPYSRDVGDYVMAFALKGN